MPLSSADRARARYHLGYLGVSPAPSIALGLPRMQQTSFLIENSFDVLMEDQVLRVVAILDTMDAIEKQMVDALSRLRAEKLDTLTLRGDEEDALEKEYCRWGYRVAGILGCVPYPFSDRYMRNAGAGAPGHVGNIPVH